MKEILVVVVTYNIGKAIYTLFDSLQKQTYQQYHLLIIDNNSTDSTLTDIEEYLKNKRGLQKKTTMIKNSENVGFSKAVNVGLEMALKNNDYAVLLLNQDVYFTDDLLENGVKVLDQYPNAGAVESKILYPDKRIWWIGTRLLSTKELLFSPAYGIAEHIHKGRRDKLDTNKVSAVEALTGCAPFLRTKAVEKVGLFNEKYFMYAEDIDYSQRLIAHGYTLLLFCNSTVFHEVGDNKMNAGVVLSHLKKYRIYLKSIASYLLEYKPRYVFAIWLLKLPFALAVSYFRRKHV